MEGEKKSWLGRFGKKVKKAVVITEPVIEGYFLTVITRYNDEYDYVVQVKDIVGPEVLILNSNNKLEWESLNEFRTVYGTLSADSDEVKTFKDDINHLKKKQESLKRVQATL